MRKTMFLAYTSCSYSLVKIYNMCDAIYNHKHFVLYISNFWSTAQYPIWLLSAAPWCCAFQLHCSQIIIIIIQIFAGNLRLYRVSQNLCHKLFLGILHPHLSKKVPINMGPTVNRFRDIHCCVETREMLWLTLQPHSTPIPEWPFPWELDQA
jgi:hypothetical protein